MYNSTQIQQSVSIDQFTNLLISLYGRNLTPTNLKPTSCNFQEDKSLSIFTGKDSILCLNDFGSSAKYTKGDAIKQIMHVKGLGFREALEYLANFIGQPLDNPTPIKRQNKPKTKPTVRLKKWTKKSKEFEYIKNKIGADDKLTFSFLKSCGVAPVSTITYQDKNPFIFKGDNIALLVGDKPNDLLNGNYKLKQPNTPNKKYKSITIGESKKYIFGSDLLPKKNKILIICEGDMDTLAMMHHYRDYKDINFICFGNVATYPDEVFNDLKNRFDDIYLLYDNDKAGKENALKQSEKHGVYYIDLSAHTDLNDVCDILREKGFDFLDDIFTKETAEERQAPKAKAPLTIVHTETEKTEVPDFPINVLPNRIQDIVEDVAEGLKIPNELLCTSILTACSAAIGNSLHTKILNYIEPASLYMAIVAGTGVGKSPAIEFACKPLDEIDDTCEIEYLRAKKEYDDIMSMTKKERDNEGIETPEMPKYITYIVKDATPEALADVMSQNKRGILNCQDELTTLINNFNRYNKGSEEEMWLSMWNQSKVKINRTGNKFTTIRMPFVSILGGTQPSKVKEFFAKDRSQTGFTNRILFCHTNRTKIPYPSKHIIPPQAAQEYKQIINNLINIPTTEDENGNIQGGLLAFTDKAESIYYNGICTIVDMQNESTDLLKGAIEKMKRYIPRFALILQSLEFATEENKQITYVQEKAINGAFELFYYFLENFKKAIEETKSTDKQNVIIGSDNETPEQHAMRLLLQGVSIREVMNSTGLKKWKIEKIKKSVY